MRLTKLDPDWNFAEIHGKASRVGIPIRSNDPNEKLLVCRCCHRYVNKKPIPMFENTKELDFIGFGFPLYFVFLKSCILLLFLSICSYNALALYSSIEYNESYCKILNQDRRLLATAPDNQQSGRCWTFMVRMASIQKVVSPQQHLIRIVSWILQFYWLIFMRYTLLKLQFMYDERNCSISDYSVVMSNLPLQKGIQKKIRQFFMTKFSAPYQIKQLTLLQKQDEFQEILQQKKRILGYLKAVYKRGDFQTPEQFDLMKKLGDVNRKMEEKGEQIKTQAKNDQIQTEKLILVFDTEDIRNQVISQFKKMKRNREQRNMIKQYFGNFEYEPHIVIAPQPLEIYWENINVSKMKRFSLIVFTWFVSIAILAILTTAVYFIFHLKSTLIMNAYRHLEVDPTNSKYITQVHGAIAIVYVILVFIMLFNKLIMSHTFRKITQLEKRETGSKFQLSFELKYCLGLFFTTAVMTLIVEGIQFENYYKEIYGVIDEETVMFFFVIGFIPLFWLINPFQVIKLIKRKKYYGVRYFTQQQANKLMENAEYDLGKRYAEVIEIIWFTYLYATLIPFGAFASFLGLMIFYWIDKFNLLRRSSVNCDVSGKLVQTSLTLLDFSLIMKPIGQLIFDHHVRHQKFQPTSISSIVFIVVGAIYAVLPTNKLITYIDTQKFRTQPNTFTEMKYTFKDTYHTCNPVYSRIHRKKISDNFQNYGLQFHDHDTQKELKIMS